MTPYDYTAAVNGSSAVFAMIEDPEPYRKFLPLDRQAEPEDSPLRSKYPRTGAYRADDTDHPIWSLDWAFSKESIVALFHEHGHHYLVVAGAGGELEDLAFLEDGKILRTYQRADWVERKWVLPFSSCGFDYEIAVRYDDRADGRRVIASSREGVEYSYDATTGVAIESTQLPTGGTVESNAAELKLSAEVSNILSQSRGKPDEVSLARWAYLLAPSLVTSCTEVVSPSGLDEQEFDEDEEPDEEPIPPFQFRATGANLAGYQRVIHPSSEKFDMYRVPGGRAADFMCGKPADEEEHAAIQKSWQDVVGIRPALATVLTMDFLKTAQQDDDLDEFATPIMVALWVRDAEWRIVGINLAIDFERE